MMALCSLNYVNPNGTAKASALSVINIRIISTHEFSSEIWSRKSVLQMCLHFNSLTSTQQCQKMTPGNWCLAKILPTVRKVCLSRYEAFLRGPGCHVMWTTLTALWNPPVMSSIPGEFLFMPAFPFDWQKIWVAPFHTLERKRLTATAMYIQSDTMAPRGLADIASSISQPEKRRSLKNHITWGESREHHFLFRWFEHVQRRDNEYIGQSMLMLLHLLHIVFLIKPVVHTCLFYWRIMLMLCLPRRHSVSKLWVGLNELDFNSHSADGSLVGILAS